MRIGVDIDSVVANTSLAIRDWFISHAVEYDFNEADIMLIIRLHHRGVYFYEDHHPKISKKDMYKMLRTPEFFSGIKPYRNMIRAFRKIKTDAPYVKYIMVTGRQNINNAVTKSWLTRVGMPWDEVHTVGRYDKSSRVKTLNGFVEDWPGHIEEYLKYCPVVICDQPWNQSVRVPRVYPNGPVNATVKTLKKTIGIL